MEATDWTRRDAYGVDNDLDFHAVVATAGARQMYRAFDRITPPLDRAVARTRSPVLRGEIEAAIAGMVTAAAVQDALGRLLASEQPVSLASALHEVCRNLTTGPHPGMPPVLELQGDVAFTLTEPSAAWAIAAAVVEMAHLVGRRSPVRFRAEFLDGHLAIVAAAIRSRPGSVRPSPAGAGQADLPTASIIFLERLATLLSARIVRGSSRGGRSVALVLKVRLNQCLPGTGS